MPWQPAVEVALRAVDGTEVLLPGKPKPGQSKHVTAKLRAWL
jgi:hypothetical protein